jgi:phosphoribosylanthranilate isomerase
MIIKVCGMREPENIREVLELKPDMMGFIFYPKSPRYVQDAASVKEISFPEILIKTGVFVNEEPAIVEKIICDAALDAVQLHGTESPAYCSEIKQLKCAVFKAFSISEPADFEQTKQYENKVDGFLFDTKTPAYGGSGVKFDWNMLEYYTGTTPFLLSGGIGKEDAKAILQIQHPLLAGIDLNSRFEISPALKNTKDLQYFIQIIRKK